MRLLDLFCKQGGTSRGYADAGFDVTGVDIDEQPRFPYDFVRADAIEYVKEHGHEYDVIAASPPCQRYSITNAARQHPYPDLIGPTRDALIMTGKPYVIENVPRSPLLDALVLCGTMFDLTAVDDDGTLLHLRRHRLFESSVRLVRPQRCRHLRGVQWAGSYGGARRDKIEARTVRHGGYVPSFDVQQRLMGIDWMTERALYEAIPPAYTHWIGMQLREALS